MAHETPKGTDESGVRYFFSLQLPEFYKRLLWQVVGDLHEDYGEFVSNPYKRKTYHITLGVTTLTKDKTDLFERLRRQLQELLDVADFGYLQFKDVGWFGNGAVYLQMEEADGYGLLLTMRRIFEAECAMHDVEILEMTHFHISLFKENKIPEGSFAIGTRNLVPLSIPIGAARQMGDDILLGARKCVIDTVELREVKRNH